MHEERDRREPGTVIRVGLETAGRRAFASALDWPGWSRSGRDEAAALDALAAARTQYATVAGLAGLELPDDDIIIVQRLPGTATTAFGAPDVIFALDHRRVDAVAAARFAGLVRASWATFDAAVADAPAELRKGPRGGGRDRDRIVAHVAGADAGYARAIGLRAREPDPQDPTTTAALRAAVLDILARPSNGEPLAGRRWPARYAARRFAWHALDHAWEIADRAVPQPAPGTEAG